VEFGGDVEGSEGDFLVGYKNGIVSVCSDIWIKPEVLEEEERREAGGAEGG
jgi:hypothetical protein